MAAFTAKNFLFDEAPARITLFGDKKRPEPAQHIIEFPGGAIELSRLDDGTYWAHIVVNRGWAHASQRGLEAALGQAVDGRIDRATTGVSDIHDHEAIHQIAVLIRPEPAA